MTKEQVLDIMGEPLRDASFHEENVWHYFVRINWYDGLYTRDECMPLVFKKGKLAGWGNEYYNREKLLKKPYKRPVIEGLK